MGWGERPRKSHKKHQNFHVWMIVYMVHSPKNSPCMLDPKGNNFQLGTGNIWRCMTCSKGQFSCFSCLFGDITLIFAWEAPLRQISRWKGTIVLLYWRKRGDSLNWKSMKAWRTYQYHLTQASMAGNLQAVLARMKWTTTQWLQLSSGDTQKFQRILIEKGFLVHVIFTVPARQYQKTTTKKSSVCSRPYFEELHLWCLYLQRIRSEHGVRCSISAWNVNRIVTGASRISVASL